MECKEGEKRMGIDRIYDRDEGNREKWQIVSSSDSICNKT